MPKVMQWNGFVFATQWRDTIGAVIDVEAIMPIPVHRDTFVLESIGEVVVSTIRLPYAWLGAGHPRWETAVLWASTAPAWDEGCDIVDVVFCPVEAERTHRGLCDPAVLARRIRNCVEAQRISVSLDGGG